MQMRGYVTPPLKQTIRSGVGNALEAGNVDGELSAAQWATEGRALLRAFLLDVNVFAGRR